MQSLKVKRVYLSAERRDGFRVLVDRLWPRGLRKAEAAVDHWAKDVAPSGALRRWFGHDPAKWSEFRRRYLAELRESRSQVTGLLELLRRHPTVTLLFGARDEAHNNAVVLAEHLRRRGSRSGA